MAGANGLYPSWKSEVFDDPSINPVGDTLFVFGVVTATEWSLAAIDEVGDLATTVLREWSLREAGYGVRCLAILKIGYHNIYFSMGSTRK